MSRLDRLHDGQLVTLDLGEEEIGCHVEAVEGDDVLLSPVSVADAGYIPSLGRPGVLIYEIGNERVRCAGAVRRGTRDGSLAFSAGDADLAPRRRALRVAATLQLELVPLSGRDGTSPGPARRLRTSDASIVGLGVRVDEPPPLAIGATVGFTLELPDPSTVSGTARVLRTDDDTAGLEFLQMAPGDRARLAAFLLAGQAAG